MLALQEECNPDAIAAMILRLTKRDGRLSGTSARYSPARWRCRSVELLMNDLSFQSAEETGANDPSSNRCSCEV